MTSLRFRLTVLLPLSLFLLLPVSAFSRSSPSYQDALEKFYGECSQVIYEQYILRGYETILWGRILNETEYDLGVIYNDSIVNRIQALNKQRENRTFVLQQKSEEELLKLKASLMKLAGGETLPEQIPNIGKVAVAEIIVDEVEINGKNYFMKLSLNLTTIDNAAQPFKMTREYRGTDAAIKNYIIKKHFSPFVTFSFVGLTALIVIALIFVHTLKRLGYIQEMNISYFYLGTLIYLIAILIFIGLTYLKHNLIGSQAFFKGAEVHFFMDTNAGLYFEPQEPQDINFTEISSLLTKKIFDRISSNLYMGRSLSEKLSDSLFSPLSWMLDLLGLIDSPIREFVELKKSDYFYKFYTFTFDEQGFDRLKPLSEGRFGEIDADFNKNLADIRTIHRRNEGQSSLIKPLLQLTKMLEEEKEETGKGKMKKFIILLTDADEGYAENIKELLKHIGFFYKQKDQYLRVFSILFPNLPKSEDKIFYFETGKLVLLSKISEMIVNLNANRNFNVEKFKKENKRYYKSLNLPIDKKMEEKYFEKLNELNVFVKNNKVPGIKEIAGRRTLMDYIRDKERQYIKMIQQSRGEAGSEDKIEYRDFFIYTFAENLYCMEHNKNSMTSLCDHQHGDCRCDGLEFDNRALWKENEDIQIDYDSTRSKYFSLKQNKNIMDDMDLIRDVFVDQFIFIGFDKERLAGAINRWLPFLTIILGLSYAWFLYRYRYHVNYKFGWHKMLTDSFIILAILLIQLALYFHIQQTRNDWVIYGNFSRALIVSLVFAFFVYIFPQAINLVLLKKVSAERDVLFFFEQPRWLINIDRYLFDFVLLPILTISIFLITGLPVLKEMPAAAEGLFSLIAGSLFLDYNNIIDIFFVVWGVVGFFYIIRSFIFSGRVEKHYKFS